MPLSEDALDRLAGALYDAARNGQTITPPTQQYPDLTQDDARAIGRRVADRYRDRAAGHRQIGWKVALTNIQVGRATAGYTRPVTGPIFDCHLRSESEPFSLTGFNMPRLEPEIVFVLDRDLAGPGITVAQALAATRGVVPACEIVDSRQPWDTDLRNALADSLYHAALVLGETLIAPDAVDLRTVGMVLECDGEVVATGAGAAVLGHPARAVAHLANELAESGESIPAGTLITTGTIVPPVRLRAGSVYTATYGGLGRVVLRVTE